MQTVTGVLKVGLDFEGQAHKEFELRPLLVRDSLETLEECKDKPGIYQQMAFYARRLVRLGTIPKEKLTTELLLDLPDDDVEVLDEANKDLQKKILGPAPAAPDSAKPAT